MIMRTTPDVTSVARARAQEVLAQIPQFHELSWGDKLSVYKSLVEDNVRAMTAPNGAMAGAMATPKRASDLIDDRRHENRRIDQAGQLAGEFVENVDFPKFVRDLLKGVFDANLQVTIQQMEAYQKLLKTATKSVAEFANAIDNTAAFGYLAENNSDDFSIDFDDNDQDPQGQPKAVLTNKEGEVIARDKDLGDNELKARIMDAKIAMAQEHRALLRETLLPRLAAVPGPRLVLPPEHAERVHDRATRLRDALLRAGYPVHGDPDSLLPVDRAGVPEPSDAGVLVLALRLLQETKK
jgi:hypothetical protein